jgi:hypothetical protein
MLWDKGDSETEILERLDTESESDLTPDPGIAAEEPSLTTMDGDQFNTFPDPNDLTEWWYEPPTNTFDQPPTFLSDDDFHNVNPSFSSVSCLQSSLLPPWPSH